MINLFNKNRKGSKSDSYEFKSEEQENRNIKDKKETNNEYSSTTEKDIISPTIIREIGKNDSTITGVSNEYYVEVGATANPARYFRSFLATMTGENTYFGILNDLYLGIFGDADCDIAIHVSASDKQKARRVLSRKIEGLRSDLDLTQKNTKRREILDQLRDLEAQEERLRRNIENLYNFALQATVSGENIQDVKKYCNVMVKRMMNHGVHFRAADTKQLHALMALTPCDNVKKDFAYAIKPIESSNLADFFPYGFGTISHNNGIPIGEDPYGKIVMYHPRHPSMQNYNSLTFGQSGSGKSMKEKMMRSRNLSFGIYTTVIEYDRDKEHKGWIQALGFKYIEFNPMNDQYTLNVFPIPTVKVNPQTKEQVLDLDDAINTVAAIIYKMLRMITEQSITGTKKIRIKEAIQDCYFSKDITYSPDSIYESSNLLDDGYYSIKNVIKAMPQLCDLYETMKSNKYMGELKEEAEIIKAFTKAGTVKGQTIFDCQTTVDFENELLVGMCVADLDEIMKPLGLYLATTNSWNAYERLPKKIPKDIVIEEAQNMMVEDDEANWLEERCRTARRRNIGMHPITQGFEVFLRKPQGLGILKNASTKFLMKQDAMDIDAVEKKFFLPKGVKNRLLSFDKGECILIVENEMIQMRTKPMPYEYKMFSTNPNE